MEVLNTGVNARIESELKVKTYIQNLNYALENGGTISFQTKRSVDENRDERYTNIYSRELVSK